MNDSPTARPVPFLDLKAQQARIAADLRRRLDAVLGHCQFILGPEVAELEDTLAKFCGAKHCVTVSSGTDALQIAMMAEGIGPGDAVFLPAFTYTATAEVPLVLGATPVFVDVDPRTFQIDPEQLRARISVVRAGRRLRPRALVGVDLFGQPADWPALAAIAAQEGLFTIDDCAQSFGASLHGRMLGTAADATATSFFPSKPLGAYGDGGALFTDNSDRATLYRSLRTHGEGTTRYEVLRTGMNGRMDTLQAAVLLSKMTVFADELAARARIAQIYDSRLGNAVTIPARVPDSVSAWAIYAILLPDAAARDRMQAGMKAAGVPSAIYYPRPLHRQPAYRDAHDGAALPVSDDLATRIMALPIHPDLTEEDVSRICDAVLANI
ncbi:DegT/DnrJ/EryC1/StrS family aminotransferase [Limobrevibacterium gyesilva]|uniref:DegT/DnrJ/EryC1/StrS family aminotransferase n=1 Tax=Limobrevibacterium gyesilva TaxID=2991712 RepID=A0AA42CG22_9PROT|nr:DegT/DnrJ/EryC1/StrS family aminotransferase [Limobrevibacterium gyesilva]MCW3477259.1 DegT/DnrJ/EryC1/StrS family aminotransferase [Limobrevibacterium gyesilva]